MRKITKKREEKSIYESMTGKKNPEMMDKIYNPKKGTTISQDVVKMTKPVIEAIKRSPAGKLPAMFKKFM